MLVSDGLELDESLISGEPEPVSKRSGDQAPRFVRRAGSVAWWQRRWAPTRTRRSSRSRPDGSPRSPELRDGVNQILRWVTFAIVPTAALLFFSQLRHHANWRLAVSGAVAGTVAMVPEGLVLLMSIAFAVAVTRLAKRNVLVQELPAVEGLARVACCASTDRNAHRRQARVVAVGPRCR